MRILSICLLWLFAACGQQGGKVTTFSGATLLVQNVNKSKQWYKDNLDFEEISSSSEEVQLQHEGFQLTLRSSRLAMPIDSIEMPVRYLQGYFKFGFTTSDIEALFAAMQDADVNLLGDIYEDTNLARRSFIARDPDGNRVQFFDSKTPRQSPISPFFIAIITADLEKSVKLYTQLFDFEDVIKNDIPSRDIEIRLLHSDDMLVEIIYNPSNSTSINDLKAGDPYIIQGIKNLRLEASAEQVQGLAGQGLIRNLQNEQSSAEDADGNRISFR